MSTFNPLWVSKLHYVLSIRCPIKLQKSLSWTLFWHDARTDQLNWQNVLPFSRPSLDSIQFTIINSKVNSYSVVITNWPSSFYAYSAHFAVFVWGLFPDLYSPELWNMTFGLKPAQQFVPHWCLILCHLFYCACYATPASFNMWLVEGRRATKPKRNANGCYGEGNPSTVASGLLLYFKYSSYSSSASEFFFSSSSSCSGPSHCW